MEETSTIAETLRNVLFFGGLVAAALIRAHHQKNPPDKTALTQTMAGRSWKTVQVATLIAALFLLYFAAGCTGQFFYEEQLPAA
ncbi:MAG: hypothetical protein OES84_05030, partial [Kiritimatiellaceae bacterium]|nr:hypothetical protein [Kiritimatiellaceae bacterium]